MKTLYDLTTSPAFVGSYILLSCLPQLKAKPVTFSYQWVDPLFDAGGPLAGTRKLHNMTRDSAMALFLLKLRYDSPYRKLGIEFGVPNI